MPPGCCGRGPPREPCHRQIERAPEEVDRAALADEARAKLLEDPIGLHEDAPEAVGVLRIVGAVRFVPIEADRIGDLVRAA